MWCMDQRYIGDVDMDMNDMLRLGDDQQSARIDDYKLDAMGE